MKARLQNNLGLKIFSILFAITLWWSVVNIDDPIDEKKYIVDVTITNAEAVTASGKSYRVENDLKSVSVTVTARKKILNEIRTTDIVATANLDEIQDDLVPIRIKITGFEGLYESAVANPRNLRIIQEKTESKKFPVTVIPNGTVAEGYEIGKLTANPLSISITGPLSSIGRISRVVAKVDVSELSHDSELHAELIYFDAADNIIDQGQLTSNVDKNGVTVKVELLEVKKLSIQLDTSDIVPGEGYQFKGVEVEPISIEVAGRSDILSNIQSISIPSAALKTEGINQNTTMEIPISEYIPEGLRLAEGAPEHITVRILLERVGTKTLIIPVRSVKVNNIPSDFSLEYGPEQEVELLFEGSDDALSVLTAEKVLASIDLSAFTKEGTYDVPVKLVEMPQGCTYTNEATVQIILKKADNKTETE